VFRIEKTKGKSGKAISEKKHNEGGGRDRQKITVVERRRGEHPLVRKCSFPPKLNFTVEVERGELRGRQPLKAVRLHKRQEKRGGQFDAAFKSRTKMEHYRKKSSQPEVRGRSNFGEIRTRKADCRYGGGERRVEG